MGVSVCPTTSVAASVQRVWSLLSDPSSYDAWWDARAESITPPGPATPGQRIVATTRELGRRWTIRFLVEEVDESAHQVVLRTEFPFGMTMRNAISVSPVDEQTSWLRFG
jgi:hypothetical protein